MKAITQERADELILKATYSWGRSLDDHLEALEELKSALCIKRTDEFPMDKECRILIKHKGYVPTIWCIDPNDTVLTRAGSYEKVHPSFMETEWWCELPEEK